MPVGQRGWSFLSTQHWWGHFWSAVSVAGLLSAKKIWSLWKEHSKWPWKRLRDWSILCKRRGWESWNCLDQCVQTPNLGEDKRRWRQNLFTGVQWQDKSQGHKLQCRKFHLNVWKIPRKKLLFFTVRIIKHWNKLAGEDVGGPHAWRQWKFDAVQCEQPALDYPTLSRGDCGKYDLQRPFLSAAMIRFCEDIDKVDAQWKLLSLLFPLWVV